MRAHVFKSVLILNNLVLYLIHSIYTFNTSHYLWVNTIAILITYTFVNIFFFAHVLFIYLRFGFIFFPSQDQPSFLMNSLYICKKINKQTAEKLKIRFKEWIFLLHNFKYTEKLTDWWCVRINNLSQNLYYLH